jgi:2-polyprenyl-3-methyl-5-hydroxy-6-metoxy-1,4-benzoquinol methylase
MEKSQDDTWEKIYRSQAWGKYPPEELIRFTARNFYAVPDRKKVKILDLGCGTGASSWYLAREGFCLYGIDGSKAAIEIAKERFEEEGLTGEFKVGNFIKTSYIDDFFDCIVDVTSIQHNTRENIVKILKEIHRLLKPAGRFFSMALNSDSYGYGLGEEMEANTYCDIPFGPLAGRGTIHFFGEEELKELFDESEIKLVSLELSERTLDNRTKKISHWIIEASKH